MPLVVVNYGRSSVGAVAHLNIIIADAVGRALDVDVNDIDVWARERKAPDFFCGAEDDLQIVVWAGHSAKREANLQNATEMIANDLQRVIKAQHRPRGMKGYVSVLLCPAGFARLEAGMHLVETEGEHV